MNYNMWNPGVLNQIGGDGNKTLILSSALPQGSSPVVEDKTLDRYSVSSEQCPGLSITLPVMKTKYFQVVEGTGTYVYSAYVNGNRIRLLAVRRQIDSFTFFCHLWYDVTDGDPLSIVPGRVENIQEDHGMSYTAAYILCDKPPERQSKIPIAISIGSKKCDGESPNLLPVLHPGPVTSKFTVCVTPLNNNYKRVHQLVEMIEFNKILGADKFVFYDYKISPEADKVLRFYEQQDLVELYPWNLPIKNIHYFGQLAALNDCLYQNRNRSRYVVYQDLDEFIIPKGNLTSWAELIQHRRKLKPKAGIFQARNVFFRREWPKTWPEFPYNEKARKHKSIVLQTTIKEAQILSYGHRSKYILDPWTANTVGIHFVWSPLAQTDRVPESEALVCHYRNWKAPNDPQRRLDDVSVVQRFGQKIVESLDVTWNALKDRLDFNPDDLS